jgi:iron(III) transport system permease protein
MVCLIPVFIGFFLPVLELINWSIQVENIFSPKAVIAASNTLYVSVIATILICCITLITNFIVRSFGMSQLINDILSIGYAVPGLILAVGITKMFTSLDSLLINFNTFITGSILGLILAYIIKTYAISNNILNSAYTSIPISLDESAKTLGTEKISLLKTIHIPMLKTGLITAFLLVMAELIKELPATLILRPFNFDTLAVSVYLLASEERMFEAAFPGLMIIIFGLIPIYFLNKLILRKNG